MIGKGKIRIPMFGKSQSLEFQCSKKSKIQNLIFGKGKIQNCNVWKSKGLEFQCLEKAKIQDSNAWKKLKFRIVMFRNEVKVQNSSVWKRQNLEFQCFEKPQFKLPMIGKGKIQNSNV